MNWAYPALMGAAIATGVIVSRKTQQPLGLSRGERLAIGLGAFCGGMLGAKLPFVLLDWEGFLSGAAWFDSGKTLVLGLVGGYFGVEAAKWALHIEVKTGDSFAAPVAAAIAVGRLACFCAGCCHGTATDLPWGVDFGDGVRRHPTQLYEFAFHASCAIILARLQARGLFRGQLIKLYIIAYLIYRFATEFIRPEPKLWLGLSVYQWAALLFAPVFVLLWLRDTGERRSMKEARKGNWQGGRKIAKRSYHVRSLVDADSSLDDDASMHRLVALVLCLVEAGVAGADWPHIRGPQYDAISRETPLADAWPASGPPRLWSRELGHGYSGFVVAGGRVFTQRQVTGGQFLLCMDAETGTTIWETRYDWAWQPGGAYPGPYASPTFHEGHVYFASPGSLVGCIDAERGELRWSVNLRQRFDAKGFSFGYAATPLVEDGRVILPVGGPKAALVALDASDGHTLWTAGDDHASYCPAMPITFQGRRCIVGYLQNSMLIVEGATGKVLHRQALSSGYDEHSAWPLYREPDLLLTRPFRLSAECLRLQPARGDAIDCKPRWSSHEFSNDVASSVLVGEHVYGFDLRELQVSHHRASRGKFTCLEWATGKVCWSTERVGHAAVLAADGKLFLLNDRGELIMARADPECYEELGRTKLFDGEICWTAPSLCRGRLYVRSPSRAVCLYVGMPEHAPDVRPAPAEPVSRSWRIDPEWLLTREREYPNDIFTTGEMLLWYVASLAMLGIAGIAALAGRAFARRGGWTVRGDAIFLGVAFLLGLVGPNLLSAAADATLFTWPVCLYAASHAALLGYDWAERQPQPRKSRWLARLGLVSFLFVVLGYYEACRAVGMFLAWAFLFGFLPAFPFTWLAVRAAAKEAKPWRVVLATLLAFSAFFWSVHLLLQWKASRLI